MAKWWGKVLPGIAFIGLLGCTGSRQFEAESLLVTDSYPPLEAVRSLTFFRGINFNGPTVSVEGRKWVSSQEAVRNGFKVSDALEGTSVYKFPLIPSASAAVRLVLQTLYWTQGSSLKMSQQVPNGLFEVSFWAIENYQDNFRSMDIQLEGTTVASAIGELKLGAWRKYGPYYIQVNDKELNIDVIKRKGDPALTGMSIELVSSAPTTQPPPTQPPPTGARQGIEINFELFHDKNGPLLNGVILGGPGYSVNAQFNNGPYGAMLVRFHQGHYGQTASRRGPTIGFPAPDNLWHTYKIRYDLSEITVYRDNQMIVQEWLDNSTTDLVAELWSRLVVAPSDAQVRFDKDLFHYPGLFGFNRPSAVRNVNEKYFALPKQNAEYIWDGLIGNTSSPQGGASVWAAFHPIQKMTFSGDYGFAIFGYNEGKPELVKFHKDRPLFILANFGESPGIGDDEAKKVAINIVAKNNILYVLRAGGAVYTYDVTTTRELCRTNCGSFPGSTDNTAEFGGIRGWPDFSQHVYKFSDPKRGTVTIGTPGGYLSPDVSSEKFGLYYDDGAQHRSGFVAFQNDGKFWLSDPATARAIRYNANYIPDGMVIMFIPHTYSQAVDKTNPTRVFNRFLEFKIDYSKPLSAGGWTLVKNWRTEGLDPYMYGIMSDGLQSVVTVKNAPPQSILENGKTYALVVDRYSPPKNDENKRQVVELTAGGLRPVGIRKLEAETQIERDGSFLKVDNLASSGQGMQIRKIWYVSEGTRIIEKSTRLGSVPYSERQDPVTRFLIDPPGMPKMTDSGKIILWDPWKSLGNHLKAVQNDKYLWQTLPVGEQKGRGTFDLYCNYGGGEHDVVGENIFVIFKGEFWRKPHDLTYYTKLNEKNEIVKDEEKMRQIENASPVYGQTNQILHYNEKGEFLGQFGFPLTPQSELNGVGSGSNVFRMNAVQVNDVIYIYTNDESSRGSQRWRIKF